MFLTAALFGPVKEVVKYNEGYSATAYLDSAGMWTICYGETKDVQKGQRRSQSDCEAQLERSITEHSKVLTGLPESLPDVVVIGMVDAGYNIGVPSVNSSTFKKRLAKGDYTGAAEAVLWFKYITLPNGQKFDCSKPNKLCTGMWERRKWQAKAIGNQFSSVDEALAELKKIY